MGPESPLPGLAWQMRSLPSAPVGVLWQFDCRQKATAACSVHASLNCPWKNFKSGEQLGFAHLPASWSPVQQRAGQQEDEFPLSLSPDDVRSLLPRKFLPKPPSTRLGMNPTRILGRSSSLRHDGKLLHSQGHPTVGIPSASQHERDSLRARGTWINFGDGAMIVVINFRTTITIGSIPQTLRVHITETITVSTIQGWGAIERRNQCRWDTVPQLHTDAVSLRFIRRRS